MATGIMLTFFDFRNDVRKVIQAMCNKSPVVLFIRKEHEELIRQYTHLGFTYRIIQEKGTHAQDRLATIAFLLFRKLPASKQNYYLMEQFKAEALDGEQRQRALSILKWQRRLPKWLSYDRYLNRLVCTQQTDLSDIDQMIAFTEIYDDHFLIRCIRERIPVKVYVYSWDHACKHVRFSDRVQYLVWNAAIARDVETLQHIPASSIRVAGATQLGYVAWFRQNSVPQPRKSHTIYFGCGVGLPSLAMEEMRVIIILAEHMRQLLPDHTLVVRLYPNSRNWDLYNALSAYPNIRLDNSYRQQDLSIADTDILQKFESIHSAVAFFHVGTTLGLEACFTSTPSFLLDLSPDTGAPVSLYHFVHQYQNTKYLIDTHPLNTITTELQLRAVLHDLHDPQYLRLNHEVQETFTVRTFEEMADALLE